MSNLRQPGHITGHFHGEEDHGIMTVMIYLQFSDGGGSQGFGGLVLQQPGLAMDFIRDLCTTFGVQRLSQLKNAPCFALRCFDGSWAPVEGLESAMTGKKFVLTTWARKHFPDTLDPLAARRKSLHEQLMHDQRRLREKERELAQLAEDYHALKED